MIDRIYVVNIEFIRDKAAFIPLGKLHESVDGAFVHVSTGDSEYRISGEFFTLAKARRTEKRWIDTLVSAGCFVKE